ncbi:hypothetical protein NDU88_011037 [Pleurodeles waltl]|uniref:Uncharacterized protein n=1 Tax=Pleurodeles waltl TaxID=8319 RepID=A0AAV7R290_PLEWA|nr:hypothetical protein NDU88_011037 [Pleurodeles waltl]
MHSPAGGSKGKIQACQAVRIGMRQERVQRECGVGWGAGGAASLVVSQMELQDTPQGVAHGQVALRITVSTRNVVFAGCHAATLPSVGYRCLAEGLRNHLEGQGCTSWLPVVTRPPVTLGADRGAAGWTGLIW